MRGRLQIGEVIVQIEKHLLRQFFRQARIPKRMQRNAEYHGLMLTHEFRERGSVAGGGSGEHQLPLGGIRHSPLNPVIRFARWTGCKISRGARKPLIRTPYTLSLSIMLRRAFVAFLAGISTVAAAVPVPKEHFGFEPGEDYKLAGYEEITGYFRKLAESSDRVRLVEYGKTSFGRTSYIAFISSPDNLKRLDEFKNINRKLALGLASPAEADQLTKTGRAIIWIDSGLHATEVAPAQHSPLLAYKMVTDETEEVRRIRDNVILMQVPVINPDGLDMVVDWYRKNLGTPYELAPLPMLYQKYVGHDNNRDWFMMNLPETRNVSRLLFQEWFPQIVYNQHQAPAFPARIFVPPYAEPLNPNIPAPIMEGINSIGSAIKERLARENKPGVLSYHGFDAWWNGGLRSAPAFHNMHGILTETAAHVYATPRVYDAAALPERFANGIPTKQSTVFYERPWLGGKWSLRSAIDYMLTVDFAILDLATDRREYLLKKAWEVARSNINTGAQGGPYAYIVPETGNALEMLSRLHMGGVELRRAKQRFSAGGKTLSTRDVGHPRGPSFPRICARLDGAAAVSGVAERHLRSDQASVRRSRLDTADADGCRGGSCG